MNLTAPLASLPLAMSSTNLAWIVGGYLIGSFSSALILTKICKTKDPRDHHSGNPGTTNMMRVAGPTIGLLTFLGDWAKSVIWLILAQHLGASSEAVYWSGLTLVLGHCFPLFHRFQGGKGVATGLGVYCALSWSVGMLSLITFLLLTGLSGVVAVASVITTLLTFGYHGQQLGTWPVALALMSLVIVARHHSNLRKLYRQWQG